MKITLWSVESLLIHDAGITGFNCFTGECKKQKSKSNFVPENLGCIKTQVYSHITTVVGRISLSSTLKDGCALGLVTSNDSSGKDMPGEESGQCQSKDNLVGTHTFFLNSSFARKLSAEKVYVLSGCMSL